MSVIGSNILAGASGQGGDYTIDESLRFNASQSSYLSWTPASAGNRKTWTWSAWVKRGNVSGSDNIVFQAGSGTPWFICGFGANVPNSFFVSFLAGSAGVNFYTAALFRDPSAWYHIVLAVDTTQATSTNRVKIYVNGTQATTTQNNAVSLNYDTQVNNTQAHYIGRNQASNSYFDGYL
ncbi:MAG TPA: LamG domain-containing protein, partial [Pseudomonadales bacterium]|nr:LamG domain-containing protein [Pseudomonadales bacterium]